MPKPREDHPDSVARLRVVTAAEHAPVQEPAADDQPPAKPHRSAVETLIELGRMRPAWVVVVVVVLAAVVAAVVLMRPRTAAGDSLDLAPSIAQVVGTPTAASPSRETSVVVDVAGKVRHPGLVVVSPGARVADAIRAAGGVLRGVDLTSVNLASRVSDGEQVLVGVPGAAGAVAAGGGSASPAVLDVNTATAQQLDALPGVGPVLAQRIVDYRTAHGVFASVDDLGRVPGIGPSKLADLRSSVRV